MLIKGFIPSLLTWDLHDEFCVSCSYVWNQRNGVETQSGISRSPFGEGKVAEVGRDEEG